MVCFVFYISAQEINDSDIRTAAQFFLFLFYHLGVVCALITVNFKAISRGHLKPAAFFVPFSGHEQPAGSTVRRLSFGEPEKWNKRF